MEFVPNTHRKQSLVVNQHIFMNGKKNKDGSTGVVKIECNQVLRYKHLIYPKLSILRKY